MGNFELSYVYEDLVDWPKRLANEEGFYREVFEAAAARSVLDAACGTGKHAAMFHSWGLRVEGADIDAAMIERARSSFGEPEGLRWTVRGYDAPVPSGEPFDVVICVGNSLAMAPDASAAERAVAAMSGALRKGGALVVHLLNPWRITEGPCLWQKHRRADFPSGEAMIVKGIHRSGSRAYVELVIAPLAEGGQLQSTFLSLTCLEADDLAESARRSGARSVEFFGSYKAVPYRREESVDCIMVART